MRGVRAEPEQEEPWGHSNKGGGGGRLGFLRNHSCALQKTGSKWGRGRMNISKEAAGKI